MLRLSAFAWLTSNFPNLNMVQYTLAQSPEIILTVSGKDSAKAREKAMDQLIELMDAGQLPTELEEGFGPQQLIEVKEPNMETASGEDAITQAVQLLSNLATLKLKVQESRTEALAIRQEIDILFSDESVTEAEISRLKEGFKILKTFAQANLRYQEARSKAENARQVLDQALKASDN
jgi:soluble cytochrome b562